MREGRTNGGVNGEGEGEGAAAMGAIRRRRQPDQPSTSGSAASSSSGRREVVEEEQGGGGRKKQGRRVAVAKEIRVRLPVPSAASCWGNGSVVAHGIGGRRRGRNRRDRADDSDSNGEDGQGAAVRAPAATWCCVCPGEDCKLEANPSANGKEDPGLRSLLERNDFYSADCNPHAAASPNPGNHSD
ncbi:hypothetical protein GUJ93_ZPchr0005g14361 [Zizania palustris]|uniref:Uncharacterized protein n=1 Tax=Zizania palustris TaxID=103762 RepID=A0A8J5STL5_ZIZPA|nr:hypothetical protein GUJ93_ZPchr0005g14361 [Zizania palustris]